jgi:hypothetical protein
MSADLTAQRDAPLPFASSRRESTSITARPAPTVSDPDPRDAHAACRAGDTQVVTKLNRLASLAE